MLSNLFTRFDFLKILLELSQKGCFLSLNKYLFLISILLVVLFLGWQRGDIRRAFYSSNFLASGLYN